MSLSILFRTLFTGFVCVIALALLAHVILFGRIQTSGGYYEALAKMSNQLARLSAVQSEFLVHCRERAGRQWQDLHQTIEGEIDWLITRLPADLDGAQSLKESHATRARLFAMLCRTGQPRLGEAGSAVDRVAFKDLVSAQLLAETRLSSFQLTRMQQWAERLSTDHYRQLFLAYSVLWILIGGLVAAAFVLLRQRVMRPVENMVDGIRRFGKGSFDLRMDVPRHDEIGELATVFNEMADSLAGMTVSRDRFAEEVAERRQTEREQRFLLDRYQLVMDGAGAAVWDWDVVNHRVEYSSRWKTMRGYADDEIGDDEDEWRRGIHPDDRARVLDAVAAHFDGQTAVFEQEYRVHCKDGAWMWVRDCGKRLCDGEGRVVRMAGTEEDIGNRRLERLREAVALDISRLLLDSPDAGQVYEAIVDSLHRHGDFPIVAMELYEEERDEMLFTAARGLGPGSIGLRAPVSQTLSGVVARTARPLIEMDAGVREEYRYQALRELNVVAFVCVPVEAHDGHVLGTLSVADTVAWRGLERVGQMLVEIAVRLGDVIEQRRLAMQIHRHAARLNLVYESMSEGLFYQDRQGALYDCNPAVLQMLGLSREEFMARSADDAQWRVIDEDGNPVATEDFPSTLALRLGKPVYSKAMGIYNPRRDDHVWVHFNAIPIVAGVSAQPVEVFVTLHDLSEHMEREKQARKMRASLAQAQKMQSVGLLTGGIAHDFNNLLGIILGHLELLSSELKGNELAMRRLKNIRHSAERAVKLVRQLLGFARQKPARSEVCSLNPLLSEIDELIQRAVTPAVELRWILGQGLWLTEIDSGDFQDAVLNLVNNARNAMPDGGTLKIETVNAVIDQRFCDTHPGAQRGQYVKLAVSDTGHGIEEQHLPQIFEPFYTSKPSGQGTGLGLSMVYGFTKRSGGYVTVESEPGKGTSIDLYLPRSIQTVADDVAPAQPLPTVAHFGEGTILVVDDEADLRELAHEILEPLGYRVLLATSGEQALEMLATDPAVDLLFSDVVMPGGIDGFELVKRVRDAYPGVKTLLTSGYNEESFGQRSTPEQRARLLPKPYRPQQLAQAVERAVKSPLGPVPHTGDHRWREEFRIGIETVDDQHRQILDLLEVLGSALEQQDTEAVRASVERLREDIRSHFDHEEALMERAGYPGLDNHRDVHQMLLDKVDDMRRMARASGLDRASLVDFLGLWWIDHTQDMDRAYVPHVQALEDDS